MQAPISLQIEIGKIDPGILARTRADLETLDGINEGASISASFLRQAGERFYQMAFPQGLQGDKKLEEFLSTFAAVVLAGRSSVPLRIQTFDLETASLPWELIAVPDAEYQHFQKHQILLNSPFLAHHPSLTIVRQVQPELADSLPLRTGALRVLAACANPGDPWPKLVTIEQELDAIRSELGKLPSNYVEFRTLQACV
jgi:hypothetical protein